MQKIENIKKYFEPIINVYSNFSVKRKLQFALLMPVFIGQAFSELISLGSVIPFITALTNPNVIFLQISNYPFLKNIFNINTPDDIILPSFLIFISLVLFAAIFRLFSIYLLHRVTYAAGSELSINLFKKNISQEYQYYLTKDSNELITLLTNKVLRAVNVVLAMINIIKDSILIIFVLTAFIIISPSISFITFVVLGGSYILLLVFVRKFLLTNGEIIAQNEINLVQITREALSGVRLLILDKVHKYFIDKFSKKKFEHDLSNFKNNFLGHSPKIIMESFGIVVLSGIAFYLINSDYEFLDLVPFFVLIGLGAQKLLPIFQTLYYSLASIAADYPSLIEVSESCKIKVNNNINNLNKSILKFENHIKFKNVSFSYNNTKKSLIDVNTIIKFRQKIGIVGHTGSGKSTFIDLLMGLNRPSSGQIFVDDILLNNENISIWQNNISHVSQTIFISNISILNNIAFGLETDQIDYNRIKEVTRLMDLKNITQNLQKGFDSTIGEAGIQISGGERQKIALSRALYKKFNVLVLDEATSSLDNKSEEKIINEIFKLNNKTIIIIAHRLTTVKNCDIILEFENGKIINKGTYDYLIKNSPSFREIAKNLKK